MVFETNNLLNASPSIISRVGIIHLPDQGMITWEQLYDSWLSKDDDEDDENSQSISSKWDNRIKKSTKELFQWLGWPSCVFIDFVTRIGNNGTNSTNNSSKDNRLSPQLSKKTIFHSCVSNNCLQPLHTFSMLLKTFAIMMQNIPSMYNKDGTKEDKKIYKGNVEGVFLLSLLYSVSGSMTSTQNRKCFTLFLRAMFHSSSALKNKYSSIQRELLKTYQWKPPHFFNSGKKVRQFILPLPESDNWFDYNFTMNDSSLSQWETWSAYQDIASLENQLNTSNRMVLIPTGGTTRLAFILKLLLLKEEASNVGSSSPNIILGGPIGCGKTIVINHILNDYVNGTDESYTMHSSNLFINTKSTNSNNIRNKLNTVMFRRKGNEYGPENGTKLKFFIEDLNVNTAIHEVVRDVVEYNGMWDKNIRKRYIDMSIISTLNSGVSLSPNMFSQTVSPRLMKYFHIIGMCETKESEVYKIFTTVMKWHFQSRYANTGGIARDDLPDMFNTDVKNMDFSIVNATYHVHSTLKEKMLPSPNGRNHYIFTMHQLNHIFSNIIQITPEGNPSYIQMIRVWCNEVSKCKCSKVIL